MLSREDIEWVRSRTAVTFVGDRLERETVAALFAKEPGAWSVAEYEVAQRLAVSGPVNLVWDVDVRDRRRMITELVPVPQPERRDLWPVMVSAAAINFAYSPQDQELYLVVSPGTPGDGGEPERTHPLRG